MEICNISPGAYVDTDARLFGVNCIVYTFSPGISHFIDSAQSGVRWFSTMIAILLYLAAILGKTAMSSVLNILLTSVGQHISAVSLLAILGFKLIQDQGTPKYVRSTAATAAFNGTMKEVPMRLHCAHLGTGILPKPE